MLKFEKHRSRAEVGKFSCMRPESKYFWLCGSDGHCCVYSALVFVA